MRWLSEHADVTVGKVVLVAPWLDPDRHKTTDFFEFEIDSRLVGRTQGVTIFNSDNDSDSVHKSVEQLRKGLVNAKYQEFHDHGHFCLSDMGTDAFPELLTELVGID